MRTLLLLPLLLLCTPQHTSAAVHLHRTTASQLPPRYSVLLGAEVYCPQPSSWEAVLHHLGYATPRVDVRGLTFYRAAPLTGRILLSPSTCEELRSPRPTVERFEAIRTLSHEVQHAVHGVEDEQETECRGTRASLKLASLLGIALYHRTLRIELLSLDPLCRP